MASDPMKAAKETNVGDGKKEDVKRMNQEIQKEEKKDMTEEGTNPGYQNINVKNEKKEYIKHQSQEMQKEENKDMSEDGTNPGCQNINVKNEKKSDNLKRQSQEIQEEEKKDIPEEGTNPRCQKNVRQEIADSCGGYDSEEDVFSCSQNPFDK